MGASRGCVCRWIVVPLILVGIAGAIFGIIRNKVNPSPIPPIPVAPEIAVNFGKALATSVQFLQIQKSGKLVNNKIPWRGDSALNDGKEAKLDLSKGLYDAGDHIKFGLPMAFTATILSWTILEYGDYLTNVGNLDPATDGLRWITDYLINAHPSPEVFCIQVGDPLVDHKCWDRPETMTENRPLLFINKTNPGSDVAGETAAALAAASLVFKSTDPTYSATLLTHSKQLFDFADNYTGISSETFPDLQLYYNSTGYNDELLWAASWLYHATGNQSYLSYVIQNGKALEDPSYFSWDDKRAGAQVLLSRVNFFPSGSLSNDLNTGLKNYRNTAERFMCVLVPGSPVSTSERTEGGLLWLQEWNSLQHTVAGSFLAVLFSNYMTATQTSDVSCTGVSSTSQISSADIRKFATSQANYILGKNPIKMSYLVGYGSYPQQVHHRGASIPADQNPSCSDMTWLESSDPNPNIATGALVGGPFFNETYIDVRTNALQGEPTTYSNALFTGLLSGLLSSSSVKSSFT